MLVHLSGQCIDHCDFSIEGDIRNSEDDQLITTLITSKYHQTHSQQSGSTMAFSMWAITSSLFGQLLFQPFQCGISACNISRLT